MHCVHSGGAGAESHCPSDEAPFCFSARLASPRSAHSESASQAALGAVLIRPDGSRSWLMVGGMSVQPAEFAKLAVIIGMSLVLAHRAAGRWRPQVGLVEVVLMLLIAAVPAVPRVARRCGVSGLLAW